MAEQRAYRGALLAAGLRAAWRYARVHRANLRFAALNAVFRAVAAVLAIGPVLALAGGVAGWSSANLIVLTGQFVFVLGVVDTFVIPGLRDFMEAVRKGELDQLLLLPCHPLAYLLARRVDYFRLADALLGATLVAIGAGLGGVARATGLVLVLPLQVLAVTTMGLLLTALSCLAFWVPRLTNILELIYAFYHLGRYPLGLYPPPVARMLTLAVPVGWVTYFPAAALTGHHGWAGAMLGAAAATSGAAAAATLVYRAGLNRYESATS